MVMVWRRIDESELDALEQDPDLAVTILEDSDAEQLFDVGTAWHGVHALLNGSAWGGSGPAFDVVLGGQSLGDPSTYEPARALVPPAVEAVATLLTETPVEQLRSGFTHARFRRWEVYPDTAWDQADVLTQVLEPAYEALRGFFTSAAAAGDGVLIRLT
jgi:hypothetical protein